MCEMKRQLTLLALQSFFLGAQLYCLAKQRELPPKVIEARTAQALDDWSGIVYQFPEKATIQHFSIWGKNGEEHFYFDEPLKVDNNKEYLFTFIGNELLVSEVTFTHRRPSK